MDGKSQTGRERDDEGHVCSWERSTNRGESKEKYVRLCVFLLVLNDLRSFIADKMNKQKRG